MDAGLFGYLTNISQFLTDVVIPVLLGLAFLFFVINVIRYFVIEGATEDGQEAAKSQVLYSVAAFIVIFIFWGVVSLLTYSFGFQEGRTPCPDYLAGAQNSPCNAYNGSGNAPSGPPTGNQLNY